MKCREVVELMTDYLEGALTAADRERFEQHIVGCDGCRAYLQQLRLTLRAMRSVEGVPIPDRVQTELVRAFRNWRSASR